MGNSLSEKLKDRINKEEILAILSSSPKSFREGVLIALSDHQPQAWRAAWLINNCMTANDERIQPYITSLIEGISGKGDGHQREFLKILNKMELDDEQEGRLFEACTNIWETISKSPSVRIFAFKFMYKTLVKYPELKDEIEFLMEDHYTENLSPGILNSFNKMKKSLKR